MIKGASIMLIVFAVSMVFYGSLEMTHDLLHYLADHHHASLHSHSHDAHHSMHDHEHSHSHDHHTHVTHDHKDQEESDQPLPSLLNFFLFAQANNDFNFSNALWLNLPLVNTQPIKPCEVPFDGPPPKTVC